jgi:hypothetical protein
MDRIGNKSKQQIHKSRVADPHYSNADPDPDQAFRLNEDPALAFRFNADPDPAFHFNADPDPGPHHSDANLRTLSRDPPCRIIIADPDSQPLASK